MKVCGVHIRRLSFPQKLIQPNGLHDVTRGCATTSIKLMTKSEMASILHHCKNLTHLCLPTLNHLNSNSDDDPDEQLNQSIQEMEHLEVVSLYCTGSFRPYLNLTNVLKELTIHTVINSD